MQYVATFSPCLQQSNIFLLLSIWVSLFLIFSISFLNWMQNSLLNTGFNRRKIKFLQFCFKEFGQRYRNLNSHIYVHNWPLQPLNENSGLICTHRTSFKYSLTEPGSNMIDVESFRNRWILDCFLDKILRYSARKSAHKYSRLTYPVSEYVEYWRSSVCE